MDDSERVFLSLEDATKLLADSERIHTFRQGGAGILIGADWDREDIIERIKKHGVELSGAQATNMGHGLVSVNQKNPRDTLFIETEQEEK